MCVLFCTMLKKSHIYLHWFESNLFQFLLKLKFKTKTMSKVGAQNIQLKVVPVKMIMNSTVQISTSATSMGPPANKDTGVTGRLPSIQTACIPEQVVLDSSSSLPQSLSPSHSQRSGMQRLFLHLNLSVGQVCWSGERRRSHIRGKKEEVGWSSEWKCRGFKCYYCVIILP